jgi:hypothetical protein
MGALRGDGVAAADRAGRIERQPAGYTPETILTVEQLADWLQLSVRKVEQLPIKSGYLGNRRRYLAKHVLEYLEHIAK